MSLSVVLVVHLIGASVWVGGHLVLLLSILPRALRTGDVEPVRAFEDRYERIGIPALLAQVVSGFLLADRFVPGVVDAFRLADALHWIVAAKIILLLLTVLLGAHARFRIIPRLSAKRLPALAGHVLLINVLALTMLVLGSFLHGVS